MNSNLENIYHGDEWGWYIDIEITNNNASNIYNVKTKSDITKDEDYLDSIKQSGSEIHTKEKKSVFKIFTETIICLLITYVVYRLK